MNQGEHSYREGLTPILILVFSLLLIISVNPVALASPSNDAKDSVGAPRLCLPEDNAVTDWTPYFE